MSPQPRPTPGTPEQWEQVDANTGLVWYLINRQPWRPEWERDDAYMDGVMGLLRATQKYRPDYGYKFSTYAMFWIRQFIGRGDLVRSGGSNARAAERARRPYDQPVSLDAPTGGGNDSDDGTDLGDWLIADDDVEHDAAVRMDIEQALAVMEDSVRDDLDRAILERLSTGDSRFTGEVGAAHGVSTVAAQRRLTRLRRAAMAERS